MSQPGAYETGSSACIACRQLKRKCNRALPECSTCVRVGRGCHYDSKLRQKHRDSTLPRIPVTSGRSSDRDLASQRSISDEPQTLRIDNKACPIDPFRHETLRKPTVDVTVGGDVSKILGKRDEVMVMATKYFDTLCKRMPFISKHRFYSRLPSMYTKPRADFSLLCLCIHLIIQYPPKSDQSVQSSEYAMIKGHASLLEASGFLSLEFVQARLLISIFEMGHGLYPAASVSIGACARTARALGLHRKRFEDLFSDDSARQKAEEEKRVWWEIVNLDRFINLCTGDALFATEDPRSKDLLPVSDDEWAEDTVPRNNHPTMAIPADTRVGPFARECQTAHLMGRVLRHIFEPTSDSTFFKQESEQLEVTLMAFLRLLIEEQTEYLNYCTALGMCSCALFTLYDSELLLNQHNEDGKNRVLRCMEDTAALSSQFTVFLFLPIENIDMDVLSPFVPYAIYQTAVAQRRMWKLTKGEVYGESLNSLKSILAHFSIRWRSAGIYLDALENIEVGFPITMNFMQGASVSARGLSSEVSRPYT